MIHPLDGCREKLARAKHHVSQINADLMANSKIYVPKKCIRARVQTKMDRVGEVLTLTDRRLVFYLRGPAPKLPWLFSIRAGEVVHHLRSSLDHLVYQLVVAHTQKPPTFNSAFPIIGRGRKKKTGWQTAAERYSETTHLLNQYISADAATLIHRLQPYHRGSAYDEDPLWHLSELDNAYKHRLLVVVAYKLKRYAVNIISRDKRISALFQSNILFEDGAKIGSVAITDPTFSVSNSDVSMDGEVMFAIAFSKVASRTNVGVFECLDTIERTVTDIIGKVSALPEFA